MAYHRVAVPERSAKGARDAGAAHRDRSAPSQVCAWCAVASAIAAVLGAVCVGVGVSALPDPWIDGYVSEGGVAAAGHSDVYRIGVAALAVSIGLLGVALAQDRKAGPPSRLPSWWPSTPLSLIIAAGLALVSSRVSCTRGCPLPPYQRTTFQDLVHAAASVGAVGFTTLALLGIAIAYPPGRMRRAARVATAVCMPLLVALTAAIAAAGRGHLTGLLERMSLMAVLASVVGVAVLVAGRKPAAISAGKRAPSR